MESTLSEKKTHMTESQKYVYVCFGFWFFARKFNDCLFFRNVFACVQNTKFCVVGVVRAIGLVVSGFYSYLKFTANQSGAGAITFAAQVYEPLQKEPIVESVDIVAEGAILPVDTLPASYNPW